MQILSFFYENPLEFKSIYERKLRLGSKHTIIKGAKYSGKRNLILFYLKNFENKDFLFLDFKDLRFDEKSLQNLEFFLQDKEIKILIFYGVDEKFCFDFSKFLQKYQIIVSTEYSSLAFDGFEELELDFLDFEEFLALNKKALQVGSFLQIGRCLKSQNYTWLNDYLNSFFSKLELEILKFIAFNLSLEFSINELYKVLKNKIKISKDKLYETVYELEKRYIISFVKHKDKSLKRVYFRDFALRNALCIKKDFNKLFANLVFCELLKLKKKLSYDKNFDFILKDEKIAFVASLPLLDVDLLVLRAKKLIPKALEANVFHIVFISLSNEKSFYESGVKVEILPFENWALSL